ncbi:hypothetical protein LCGC14_1888690, partial [marine sediment metagenome]
GTEIHPSYYEIWNSTDLITSGIWNITGEEIIYDIDGLLKGIYNFTIIIYDTSSNSVFDSVEVNVTDDTFDINDDWEDVDDATGTYTGGDATITGVKNWTSFTVASGKIVTVDAGATFKVRGTATISGTITITGAMQLYATTITIGAAGTIAGTSHLRANTLTITAGGTLETDLCQLSRGDTTYEAGGDCRSGCGLVSPHENVNDGDFDTAVSVISNGVHSGSVNMTTIFQWASTKVESIKYRVRGHHTFATKDGSANGSNEWELFLEIDGEWISQASGSDDSGTVTTTTGWNRCTGIKAESAASANGVSREYMARTYHYELQAKGYPTADYINSSGTVPPSTDIEDFVNPLEAFSETSIVREGTYSLRVECSPGADTLNENLTQTLSTVIDLSNSTHDDILIDVYASRSGTQFQFGMGESTPTYVNVAVATANTWETITLDFSGLGDSSKNAVDTLALKFTNTDDWNTVYVDNIRTARDEDAVYTSQALQLEAGSMGSFYWNENLAVVDVTTYGDIEIYTRAAATSAAVTASVSIDTVTNASNKFTESSHGLSNGERIMLGGTTAPTGLNFYTMYFVVGVAGNDFQVSLTSGGSVVTFSDDGTAVTYKKWDAE